MQFDESAEKLSEYAGKIMELSRTSASFKMKFLSNAITFLQLRESQINLAVDGEFIYYNPEYVIGKYKEDATYLDYAFLHMTVHCLFQHLFMRKQVDHELWNAACDIYAFYIIKSANDPKLLHSDALKLAKEDKILARVLNDVKLITPEHLVVWLSENRDVMDSIIRNSLFAVDLHDVWYDNSSQSGGNSQQSRKKKRKKNKQKQKQKQDQDQDQEQQEPPDQPEQQEPPDQSEQDDSDDSDEQEQNNQNKSKKQKKPKSNNSEDKDSEDEDESEDNDEESDEDSEDSDEGLDGDESEDSDEDSDENKSEDSDENSDGESDEDSDGGDGDGDSEDGEDDSDDDGDGDGDGDDSDYDDGDDDDSDSDSQSSSRQQLAEKWKNMAQRAQTSIDTGFLKGDGAGNALAGLQQVTKEDISYEEFLRKFSVLTEQIVINMDEFDYSFYTYGLQLYGNVPLIEPLEYKDTKRIHDFVIAIDTSGSTYGPLVQKFLSKTFNILSEQESFDSKVCIHIIQCDTKIRSDVKIQNLKDLEEYMRNFQIYGGGGTDFRPVFKYVDDLIEAKEFTDLRGLLYFTDGYGDFPITPPLYETAFTFIGDDHCPLSYVPDWAITIELDKDEFKEVNR